MSLLWIDGFDSYGSNGASIASLMNTSGYLLTGVGNVYASNVTEAGIGYSMTINYNDAVTLPFGTSSGIVMGFRMYATSATGQVCMIGYNNLMGANNSVVAQLRVWLDGQNGLAVGTMDGDLLASTQPNCILQDVWYYVELYYVPHATAGQIVLK